MRAIQYTKKGVVAEVSVPQPQQQKGFVLVRPLFTGICGTDDLVVAAKHSRAVPPVTLGHEFSAVVTQDSGCGEFRAGDVVAVEPLLSCGTCRDCSSGQYNRCTAMRLLGIDVAGSLAEVVAVPSNKLHLLPAGISPMDGALIEPLAVAVHLVLRAVRNRSVTTALVFGGGPIGLLAGLVLQSMGIGVFVAEVDPFRRQFAASRGMQILASEGDLAAQILSATGGVGVDAAFEATGLDVGVTTAIASLAPGGVLGCVGLPKTEPGLKLTGVIGKELEIFGSRVYTSADFTHAIELVSTGRVDLSGLVTRTVEFDHVIAENLFEGTSGTANLKIMIRGVQG